MGAKLLLEDGSIFYGTPIGTKENIEAEVVVTTSMTGFQETLTDPSYCNQIVTFTYPLVGNCGINRQDFESSTSHVSAIITKELCVSPSHFEKKIDFDEYLKSCKITGLTGVDTRKLANLIRTKGTMKGKVICDDEKPVSTPTNDLVKTVTTVKPYVVPGGKDRIVALDFGVKKSLLESLSNLEATVIVLPAFSSFEEIMSYEPDGILLSNGPGDPKDISEVIPTIKKLLEEQIPLLGICLGHQLLGLSLGFESVKMKYGHRGGNHPVKDLDTKKVWITSQNHGYTLKASEVLDNIRITHVNLNDDTIEGFVHKSLPVLSVQFHPEAGPGPQDSKDILFNFSKLIKKSKVGDYHG
ncbi:carbamoyl phosphate synthase small subunit [Natranaerobius trueperi]|uniref:Carbamoyl phosphate synthase small chain n=1 Tax=Natranaerobius trueperi TaxID=759412 RepID=A0A226BWN0_9FIRM|nr:carbamoyl phosphate synthase small subunit [Natranaerobius trueperi]OWZ83192.1 carbamoyl phosphate synthase small subunit [Natranaerobius trueperi]